MIIVEPPGIEPGQTDFQSATLPTELRFHGVRERTRTANRRGHNPVLFQLSYPHSTPYGTRTHDPLIKSQVLYQLS